MAGIATWPQRGPGPRRGPRRASPGGRRRGPRGRRGPVRNGAAGYSLVVLIMAISVLNIMLAAALPKWSGMIKRDKEEELISRGWQYAEALRIFQRRYQRYPVKLDELILVKPRCIRRLWKDPMTESGEWTLIFQGQGSPINVPGVKPVAAFLGNGIKEQPTQTVGGPIVGVRSKSTRESLLRFFGHDHYDEWEFRADMLAQTLNQRFGGGGVKLPASELSLSTRWLGRPMPDFVPPGGMPPGGMPPGGQPGGPPKQPGGTGGNPLRPNRP